VRFVSLVMYPRETGVFDVQPEIPRLVTAAGWPASIVEMQGRYGPVGAPLLVQTHADHRVEDEMLHEGADHGSHQTAARKR
jgi:hypothetical protein